MCDEQADGVDDGCFGGGRNFQYRTWGGAVSVGRLAWSAAGVGCLSKRDGQPLAM